MSDESSGLCGGRIRRRGGGRVSVFERGLPLSDDVYEVSTVLRVRLVDNDRHFSC